MSGLLAGLAPAVGQAAVAYRISGNGCSPSADEYGDFTYMGEYGLTLTGTGNSAGVDCAIPTSDSTFSASTITQANVRYYITGTAEHVYATLYFHDHDSHDYVECEDDEDTNVSSAFGQLTLPKTCSGYESTWGVTIEVAAYPLETYERLWVKLITVYN